MTTRRQLTPAECDRRIRELTKRSLELSRSALQTIDSGASAESLDKLKQIHAESETIQREIDELKAALLT